MLLCDMLRDKIAGSGEDTSAARPMADTRFGDIVDVLTDAADSVVIARYRVVIVAGHINVAAANQQNSLAEVLLLHALNGGVVVVAAGNVLNSSAGILLTGFVPSGHLSTSRAWSAAPAASPASPQLPSVASASFHREALSFAAGSLAPEDTYLNTSTSALVRLSSSIYSSSSVCSLVMSLHRAQVLTVGSGSLPLVVKRTFGAKCGSVITCTVPWFEGSDAGAAALAGPCAWALDHAIAPVAPVEARGRPLQFR
jgi:hypothetical protein